jgi:hypothetical protein
MTAAAMPQPHDEDRELKDRVTIERSSAAHAILESDLFVEICFALEADLKKRWATTRPEDNRERDTLYWELRGLKSVLKTLRSSINAGKVVNERLKREANGGDNVRNF